MSILCFADQDGDQVAVESAAIIGISVGTVNGPHKPDDGVTVTLIWAAGVPQPFMVAAPFAEVLAAWTAARDSGGTAGHPGFHGWPVNWWDEPPGTALPSVATWGPAKTGGKP